jgi:hypothetical protein
MKKLKLSVGVLAFFGLATLNFTQSEKGLVKNSLAENQSIWSTAFSVAVPAACDIFEDMYGVNPISVYSALSDVFSYKYDCSTTGCELTVYSNGVSTKVPGEKGCCVGGNTRTQISCPYCPPLQCEPKKS